MTQFEAGLQAPSKKLFSTVLFYQILLIDANGILWLTKNRQIGGFFNQNISLYFFQNANPERLSLCSARFFLSSRARRRSARRSWNNRADSSSR